MRYTSVTVSGIVAMSVAGIATAATVNFNPTTSLTDNFSFSGTSGYSHSTTGGVNSSGSAVPSGTTAVASYNGESYDLTTTGNQLTLSMFFRTAGSLASNVNDTEALRLGLVPTLGSNFGGTTGAIFADVRGTGTAGTYNFGFGGQGISPTSESSTFALSPSTYYKFEVIFTKLVGTNVFDVDVAIYNYGGSGAVVPGSAYRAYPGTGAPQSVTIASGSFAGTLTSLNGLGLDSSVYAAFKSDADVLVTNLDEFSTAYVAVPEPTSLAGAAMLAGLLRRRRV